MTRILQISFFMVLIWTTFLTLPSDGGLLQLRDPDSPSHSLQLYQEPKGLLTDWAESLGQSLSAALHFVGSIVPLRGMASFAADIGLPGAQSLKELLTPRHAHSLDQLEIDRADERYFESTPRSYTPYKAEMSSLVGAILGEDQCLLKLACLSGKHVNSLSGATTLTMVLSAASGYLPNSVQTPYLALKESVMYTTNCHQYSCAAA
eukprot:TCALIF_08707-PA protein Name:"Protein of unknown function" AED:0.32 eAED:0.35 QI:0/-1/0/1/-1/1/1/0/205